MGCAAVTLPEKDEARVALMHLLLKPKVVSCEAAAIELMDLN